MKKREFPGLSDLVRTYWNDWRRPKGTDVDVVVGASTVGVLVAISIMVMEAPQ